MDRWTRRKFFLTTLAGSAFAGEGLVLTQHAWQVTPITILAMGFLVLALVFPFAFRYDHKARAMPVEALPHLEAK